MEPRTMIPAVSPYTRQVPLAAIMAEKCDTTSWGGDGDRLTICPEDVNSHGNGQQIHKVCIEPHPWPRRHLALSEAE